MREIIILAAGTGTKMFPYDEVGSKTLRKAAGDTLLGHMLRSLRSFTAAPVHVVTLRTYFGDVSRACAPFPGVTVHGIDRSDGTAQSLLAGFSCLVGKDAMVLYGDTWIDPKDLQRLWEQPAPAALAYPLGSERAADWICATVSGGRLASIGAHHRGSVMTHRLAAYVLPVTFSGQLVTAPAYFPGMKVGEGAPREPYLEAALSCALPELPVACVEGSGGYFDVDKPWHLLQLNEYLVHRLCGQLTETSLGEGSAISPAASVHGFVRLGRNSYLGERVRVDGNLIVGNDTVIDNGAIFAGDAVVGSGTRIANYCQIYDGCSIGDRCILDHAAELIGGLLQDKVYLYHFCEFYGMIGSYTDLGAGTLCGTLRFDDNETRQRVKGRWEPSCGGFGDAVYLGDYCRTGVGALLMPGSLVGSYSVVGPGVLARGTVPHRTCLMQEQQQIKTEWGEHKYGW